MGYESEDETELGLESEYHEYQPEADPFIGGFLSKLLGGEEMGYESEADRFIGGFFKGLINKAKSIAPRLAQAIGGMVPGGGQLLNALGGLFREGEAEVQHLEAELYSMNEGEGEIGPSEAAHEAAMGELLAAQAAEAESEAEAVSLINAGLPFAIVVTGRRRTIRPVVPALAQASGRMARLLRRQGPAGRQLLRAMPTIQRRAVSTLRAAQRAGQPVTAPLAVQAMAGSARRVLGNPRLVARTTLRNAVLRQRLSPRSSRRMYGYPSRRANSRPFRQPY
jgi:hypothetical protein